MVFCFVFLIQYEQNKVLLRWCSFGVLKSFNTNGFSANIIIIINRTNYKICDLFGWNIFNPNYLLDISLLRIKEVKMFRRGNGSSVSNSSKVAHRPL